MLLVGTVLPVTGTLIIDTTTSSNMFGNILYVGGSGDGNYTKIQDAINDSSDGDTVFVYAYSSPYYECVKVNKSIFLIGEDKDTTVIDGSYSGYIGDVVYVSADGVTVSGFTIQNSGDEPYDAGIDIQSNSNTITDNTISNNRNGIVLEDSSKNTITGNNITSNNNDGLIIRGSNRNTISGNTINSNNGNGITICLMGKYPPGIRIPSKFNTITGNTISLNNRYGIRIYNSGGNTILKNNFIDNERDAFFDDSFLNQWKQNYWNRPRILPYFIFGEIWIEIFGDIEIRWINIDWNPAQEPYDI